MVEQITQNILNGKDITYNEAEELTKCDLDLLYRNADIIKNNFCGKSISLCSIISGRSGNCSENCKFCAQSAHYETSAACHSFLDSDTILKDCIAHQKKRSA